MCSNFLILENIIFEIYISLLLDGGGVVVVQSIFSPSAVRFKLQQWVAPCNAMYILCSIAVYCVSTLLFWHKDAGCVTKVYRNPNCSDGVGWSKEQCSFATRDCCWPIEQTFSYGTDIKIIDYGEVLEAFILSNQINKTRLRKFFLRTFFRKFERHMKQI